MVDKNLIQGAATLAQADGNMSRAFGAGLTQEATRIAGDIMKREEERQAQVKNDMNLAAQFIGKMASTGTAAGQYKNILTSEGMNVKNKLNEIALDPSLNAVEKAAAYTRAVDEYNVLASTYAGDQEKLVNLQGIVRAGNYSNTVNRNTEEFEIARALGTGNYEIVKDGYVVNGKTITSAELDNYVGLYKPKNMEAFSTFDGQLRNSIRNAKGNKDVEKSILNEAINIPAEQKLNYLVDYKDQAYSNFVNENNELNEDVINTAYKTEMDNLRTESAVKPIVEIKEVGGVDAFKAITNQTNRYINEGRLAGENSVLLRKKIDGKEVRKVTDLGDGKFRIRLQERVTGEGIETTTLNLDILNRDDRRKIDDAFAAANYSGKALGDYKNFYLQNIDNIEMPERKELESTDTNTTTITDYPDFIKNASTEEISASEAKKFIGRKGSQSIGNQIIATIQNDYEGVYSEKNIREAAWDTNAKGTDTEGRAIGKTAFEAGGLESETKKEKVNLLLETTNTTPATKLSKDERDDISNKDRKDLKKFGIVKQIAGVTKKDLAILEYMREAGFEEKTQYEEALASIDTGELPINNES